MIIETRYRDVPWEEVAGQFNEYELEWAKERWPALRGQSVRCMTPGTTDGAGTACNGPFYDVVPAGGRFPGRICPHIAEIGD